MCWLKIGHWDTGGGGGNETRQRAGLVRRGGREEHDREDEVDLAGDSPNHAVDDGLDGGALVDTCSVRPAALPSHGPLSPSPSSTST